VFVAASILTGAAVLRATARVFAGLGSRADPAIVDAPAPEEVDQEFHYPHRRVPRTMTFTSLALAACGLGIGLLPEVRDAFVDGAHGFFDRGAYVAAVLHGRPSGGGDVPTPSIGVLDVLVGLLTVAGACALAYAALAPPRPRLHRVGVAAGDAIWWLRSLHTGYVADYVTWLVTGAAVLGGVFAVTLTT